MTTKSGKKYKKDEMTDKGTTGGVGVAEMMKLFMEDRKQREDDLAQERRRQDKEVREQMRLLQEMVESSQRRAEAPARSFGENDKVKLSKFSEADDVEAYLTTLERMMVVYEVDRARWVYKLALQLMGKAQKAYAAMATEDASDYDKVKAAILMRYNINDETYRQRFRADTKTGDENYW